MPTIKILVPSTGYPRPTATWSFEDKVLEAGGPGEMKTLSAHAELVISPGVNVQTRAFIH